MPTEDRCPVTELLRAQCAHCRLLDLPPAHRIGSGFAAAYPGQCWVCEVPYLPGDRIRSVTDADGSGYLGPCCADDAG